ncbi:MAG: polysaccharide deacetylase family protein [Candidatus Altiarchaeota archaeon]|nr:polysaccharide deacetylase family protein [Candidatus Altiarchaeota archaeon]
MILTIDIEPDWGYDSSDNLQFLPEIFDFLRSINSCATLFIVGSLADRFKDIRIPKKFEIASHSMNHRDLTKLDEQEQMNEIVQSKEVLEHKLKTKINGFRAPFFLAPDHLWSLLGSAGYSYSSSLVSGFFPGRYKNKIPDKPFERQGIKEIPLQSFQIFGFPFGLSFLRIAHPISNRFVPKDKRIFYFHPTELLERRPGPLESKLVRLFYQINRGKKAKKILFDFLESQAPTQSIRQAYLDK